MKTSTLLLAASLALAAPLANAAVVFDDTFEADSATAPVGSFATRTSLINWNVTSGNVDVLGTGFSACSGCLDLDGSGSQAPATLETIASFNFLAGVSYTLDLIFTRGTGADPFSVQIGSFGDSFAGSTAARTVSYVFAPLANFTSTLSIVMDVPPNNFGPYLDRVTLTSTPSAVPLPASLPLLALALGGIAALRRRKIA